MTPHLPTFISIIIITITLLNPSSVNSLGVNWGTTSSHTLPPTQVVNLLKQNKITKLKLFDTNPQVLQALSGSDIDVTVGVPNDMLKVLNGSVKAAQSWVHDNLTRYVSGGGKTRVEYVIILLHYVYADF